MTEAAQAAEIIERLAMLIEVEDEPTVHAYLSGAIAALHFCAQSGT
jgi:hypothetical protein